MTARHPCGTPAAYVRHLRTATPPCGPCKAAHAAYERGRADQRRIDRDIRQLVHVLACALGVGRTQS